MVAIETNTREQMRFYSDVSSECELFTFHLLTNFYGVFTALVHWVRVGHSNTIQASMASTRDIVRSVLRLHQKALRVAIVRSV